MGKSGEDLKEYNRLKQKERREKLKKAGIALNNKEINKKAKEKYYKKRREEGYKSYGLLLNPEDQLYLEEAQKELNLSKTDVFRHLLKNFQKHSD